MFHKLIRPQFRHHARLCYSTSCSRPYVDYREYTQYQELNWTETARTKEQRPIHCVRCQVVMANGMPIAATCACANWSSWMCVYGNSQRSNRHRQRLCSELESTICSHISIIEWPQTWMIDETRNTKIKLNSRLQLCWWWWCDRCPKTEKRNSDRSGRASDFTFSRHTNQVATKPKPLLNEIQWTKY